MAETDHALLRRAAGSNQSRRRDRALPLRARGLAAPRRGARRARTIDPPAWWRRARARRRGRRRVGRRGGRRLARPAGRSTTWCATSRGSSACRWWSPPRPALGTINHTLLTVEAARAAGLEVAAVVFTPWPAVAADDRALQPRDDRAARPAVGVETLPADRPRRPGSWPSARLLDALSRRLAMVLRSSSAGSAPRLVACCAGCRSRFGLSSARRRLYGVTAS